MVLFTMFSSCLIIDIDLFKIFESVAVVFECLNGSKADFECDESLKLGVFELSVELLSLLLDFLNSIAGRGLGSMFSLELLAEAKVLLFLRPIFPEAGGKSFKSFEFKSKLRSGIQNFESFFSFREFECFGLDSKTTWLQNALILMSSEVNAFLELSSELLMTILLLLSSLNCSPLYNKMLVLSWGNR